MRQINGGTPRILLLLLSFVIVAFGQPAWFSLLGIIASLGGYALFWTVLIQLPSAKQRFWLATFWFAAVQAVQLSWFLSHPFWYIYGVFLFLIVTIGMQFGILGVLLTPARLKRWPSILGLAGLFTIFEWLRLYLLSGFSFNPVGLALTSTIWGLQVASLVGIYGLTFWVIFLNLFTLRVWLFSPRPLVLWTLVALTPYLFGFVHLQYHRPFIEAAKQSSDTTLRALLVQTAFPTEETLTFPSFESAVEHVEKEWEDIFAILKLEQNRKVDLLALPEYVVPYGTYLPIYSYTRIKELFIQAFGEEALKVLPALKPPLALDERVTNAFICQGLANLFQADVVVGLQDDQWVKEDEMQSYSAAFYFWPGGEMGLRYEKRVLLPMGEYIPFEFCREMAKTYGITGSFTCGTEAKVFPGCKAPFGLSICYEETYGHLMRENRLKGAEVLINLTSDVWYPNSRLPQQHFDHARLRAIEAGIPLIRACNTGITGAFDSLGQIIGRLGEEAEWERTTLYVEVPLYDYTTLYARLGDWLVLSWSFLCILGLLPIKKSP